MPVSATQNLVKKLAGGAVGINAVGAGCDDAVDLIAQPRKINRIIGVDGQEQRGPRALDFIGFQWTHVWEFESIEATARR